MQVAKSDDPIIGQVDHIIDTASLASSVVTDQPEIDHQGTLMEGSRCGGVHDSPDEHPSKYTSSVSHSHNEDTIVPPPSNPKVGYSDIDHVASASELSLLPIDVTTVAVGAIHGFADGQQPQQADTIVGSSVANGDNGMILSSASSHDVGSSQDAADGQKSENAHFASIDSKSNNQITSPNDSTQPHLVAPSSVDGSVKDTLDEQQTQGADSLGGITSSSSKINDSKAEYDKKGNVDHASHFVLPRKKMITSMVKYPNSGSPALTKGGVLNKGHIDTASPFDSVKEAGSKFGGMVRWKSCRTQNPERRRCAGQDLEKLQEQMIAYKRRSVDAEEAKIRVLMELDSTNKQISELKLSLERAQTEENQAKQDSELAMLRAEEMEQGICNEVSVAAKEQLEVAKARHAAAVEELKSINEEMETLRKEYASMVTERDTAVKKAEEAVSASKEVERRVEELTIELMATKESLESANAAHMVAEEKRIGAAVGRDQDTLHWEKDLKQTEEELKKVVQQIELEKYLKPKLDTASILLHDLKSELTAYRESKFNLENNGHSTDVSDTPEKRTLTKLPFVVASAKQELEEVKLKIEKTTAEVDSLKVLAVSLKSELQKEESSLATIKQTEGMPLVVASPKDDTDNTESRLDSVQMNEKEGRDKMVEVPKKLQQATQEALEAKSLAQTAHEELRKVKEEAEQAKARASTMESRLLAVQKEIEAAEASKKLALDATKALQGHESAQRTDNVDSPDGLVLCLEEYYDLSKCAYEAEEQANMKLAALISQVEVAKRSQSSSLEKLAEVNREMAERKEQLKIALEKAEKAKEGKLGLEHELRQWRAEHEQRRKATELSHGGKPTRTSFEGTQQTKKGVAVPSSPCSTLDSSKAVNGSSTESESSPEAALFKKKKQLFPKIAMFFNRKKLSLLKSKSKFKFKSKSKSKSRT
ncbi:Protein WEAK CHLOROPLAST MOVEMENT UNDER BLUE LIGHT-like 1 [Hibiscus syriacus]|uniref:Protein WEAK CHLOROPLAST MOVEMENT UNDER BLUE LIGHT-like 1 n=1 Tax=Hibiscus syriacus TaxID=106335 RepID=A0A6A2ZFB3_HIBSY|nr:protein WEAK CHLOROPLAST MOVEMENT UNDER BLUE LIGHT 1-like [Hibiscus syriacus]KAE8690373.1 Protein WEAK CHLOROPLAST MOVEMENT UNDER BLUE LIGHT-like 1 [Hibiscus syriacus]